VFITAVPITKLFAWGEGYSGGHVLRETTREACVDRDFCLCRLRLVCPSRTGRARELSRCLLKLLPYVCVFITAVPITKLTRTYINFQRGLFCVFITAVPIIKLFACGEWDNGGHVL
jgi:hypothetical protein